VAPVRAYRRTSPQDLAPPTRWLLALQALALTAGAIAIVVLTATSHTTYSTGFIVTDVVGAILLATLLIAGPQRRWARTPIVLVELIAVLVSFQVWTSGRHWIALAVGIPATVALVLLLLANRHR
jgi:hypothetical protein